MLLLASAVLCEAAVTTLSSPARSFSIPCFAGRAALGRAVNLHFLEGLVAPRFNPVDVAGVIRDAALFDSD